MAMPKKQMTRTRSGNRRSHLALKRPTVVACSNCGAPTKPHNACAKCGYYRGVKVTR